LSRLSQGVSLLGAEALQLGAYTLLDRELEGLQAGYVGLCGNYLCWLIVATIGLGGKGSAGNL
jgi:hypothetical protein